LCCHSDNCCGVARASARARLDRGRPHSQSIWSPFLLDLRNSDGYVAVEMSSSGASFPARAARWYTSAGARRSLVHVCRARLAGTRLMPRAARWYTSAARGSLVHVCRAQLAGLMAGVGLSSPPNPPRPTCSMCRFGAGVLKDGCTRPSVAPTTSLSLFWLVLSRRVLAARGGAPRSGRPLRSHTRPPVPCACVCVCACVCERVRGACGRHHCTLVGGRRQAASL